MDKCAIEDAIRAFENYNQIKIQNYMSDAAEADECCFRDNYIGQDVFQDHIEEWLEFFEEKDQGIFLELLGHYRYYTENKLRKVLRRIVCQVQSECDPERTYFVTFPSKEGVKSGGDDLRSLLQIVSLGEIKKDHIISDTDKNVKDIVENAKAIIFLDDVVGSGMTLYGNIKACIEKLKLSKHPDIKLFVAVIYGHKKKIESKVKDLQKLGVRFEEEIIAEEGVKCFDEAHIFSDSSKVKQIVETYETEIEMASEPDGKSYILGFDKNQFLVSFRYNTPNNTLCNFWRPSSISTPLFIRTSYKRPNISDIRKNKENNERNAYLRGKMRIKCNEGE